MASHPEHMFDKRVVQRHIKRGLITREEYEAWLAAQEDCADMAEEATAQFTRTTESEKPS